MKKNLIFALMLAGAGMTGCNKADNPCDPRIGIPENGTGIAPGGCYPVDNICDGVICTAQFAEMRILIQNGAGAPVTLDSFVVTDLSGAPLRNGAAGRVYGHPADSRDGWITLVNDAWVQGHQNSSQQVFAKGFIAGSPVFSEPYTITADCCHVGKSSGKDVITIP